MSYAAHIALALALAASTAAADPVEPRLLTAPTAWLPDANGVIAAAGVDTRGQATIVGDYGLGGVGEVELGVDNDARECSTPPCGTGSSDTGLATVLHLARAGFRLGAPQDALFSGEPAVVLGVRETIGAGHAIGEAYVVASRELGPLRLHAGIDALESSIATTQLYPIAGLEYTPPQFRKTTLMTDVAWQPIFGETLNFERVFGVGVRYQTFTWLTVELDYRTREDESLAGSTVLARVIAHWPPKRCARRCGEP